MTSTSQIAGFILAGGESSRMGRDKALLELGGIPVLVRTARLVESVAGHASVISNADAYRKLGLSLIGDDWPGAGPLGGIATAVRVSPTPWSLVVACDLPYLQKAWLDYLVARALSSTADAVVPMNACRLEPLSAMYHKRSEPAIRAALEQGARKLTETLKELRLETIEPTEWKGFDSEGLLFKNMNSPDDYEEARTRFGDGSSST
jgi:molybdenum cofactor guanylyltransferase